jgi:hypothetical protein
MKAGWQKHWSASCTTNSQQDWCGFSQLGENAASSSEALRREQRCVRAAGTDASYWSSTSSCKKSRSSAVPPALGHRNQTQTSCVQYQDAAERTTASRSDMLRCAHHDAISLLLPIASINGESKPAMSDKRPGVHTITTQTGTQKIAYGNGSSLYSAASVIWE